MLFLVLTACYANVQDIRVRQDISSANLIFLNSYEDETGRFGLSQLETTSTVLRRPSLTLSLLPFHRSLLRFHVFWNI